MPSRALPTVRCVAGIAAVTLLVAPRATPPGAGSWAGLAIGPRPAEARPPTCPQGMAFVDPALALAGADTGAPVATPSAPWPKAYCIDRYEASLTVSTDAGERPFSPFEMVKGRKVRAVSRAQAIPQGYISRNEAAEACHASHKRLCEEKEWTVACRGKRPTVYPYGDERKPGFCNDQGASPLASLYPGLGPEAHGFDAMNDPRLNAMAGTVAPSGSHPHCRSSFGVYDMMGNLHEWIADPAGTFLGGYYLDTHLNGDGCDYKTVAHDADYHDYSTGFRCCADAK